jgi:hypothetical protein
LNSQNKETLQPDWFTRVRTNEDENIVMRYCIHTYLQNVCNDVHMQPESRHKRLMESVPSIKADLWNQTWLFRNIISGTAFGVDFQKLECVLKELGKTFVLN